MGEKVQEHPTRDSPKLWVEGKEYLLWSARKIRLLSFEGLQKWLLLGCFLLNIVALTNGPLLDSGSNRGDFETSFGLASKGSRKLAPRGLVFTDSNLQAVLLSFQQEMSLGQEEVRTFIELKLASLENDLSHRVHEVEVTLASLQRRIQAPTPPNLYMGNNVIMCWNMLFEMYFFLDSRDGSFAPHLCRGVQWEIDLTKAVMNLVKPGQNVVNVGSAVGWYTAALMSAVGPGGRVLSVEANQRLAELQERSFKGKGWLDRGQLVVVNRAISRFDDQQLLVEDDMSWFFANRVIEVGAATDKRTQQMSSIRLDTLLEDQAWTGVDFISIDVEGSEAAVWDSMPLLLSQEKSLTVLMKVHFDRYKHDTVGSGAFLNKIRKHFPTLSSIDQEGKISETTVEFLLKQSNDVILYLVK